MERGAKADVKDTFYGMTAIGAAAEKDAGEIVRLLLAKGAKGAGEPMLLMAAGKGKVSVLQTLLQQPSWEPRLLSEALVSAEAGKHARAVALLKAAGAQVPPPLDAAALLRLRGRYASMPQGREVLSVEPQGGIIVVKGESEAAGADYACY
ncbi:MAG TPA: hypothetical protein VES20_24390 [Bryobacteraceae bacterium]|nr:hypothetical protein [Bryobacteraceae bacterium]